MFPSVVNQNAEAAKSLGPTQRILQKQFDSQRVSMGQRAQRYVNIAEGRPLDKKNRNQSLMRPRQLEQVVPSHNNPMSSSMEGSKIDLHGHHAAMAQTQ